MSNVDVDGVQVLAILDENGHEVGDPIPVAPPVGLTRRPTMAEQIQTMIRREMSNRAQAEGFETFDEAEDFDIDDDPLDPRTPYEAVFDPPQQKEIDDGNAKSNEGRTAAAGSGADESGKKPESESKPEPKSADKGSVRKGSKSDTDVAE